MDELDVLKIAEADLRRRLEQMSPKVDAQIEEVLKICGQRLSEAGKPKSDAHWDAEFNFWHKIISEEVERTRFNEGYEPVQVYLYARKAKSGPAFIGETQIGHIRFKVTGDWGFDSEGKKILKIEVLKLR